MEQVKFPSGLKRTKPRMLVWQVLLDADKPLDAQEIYARVLQHGTFALSTVYRVLTALEEADLVTKTTMLGKENALYALRRSGHAHYAICLRCHKQVELKECPLAHVDTQTQTGDFTVTDHRLELYGYCRDCQNKRET